MARRTRWPGYRPILTTAAGGARARDGPGRGSPRPPAPPGWAL